MRDFKLTDDDHTILLMVLGMALSSCHGDEYLIKLVRSMITLFAPESIYALKKE